MLCTLKTSTIHSHNSTPMTQNYGNNAYDLCKAIGQTLVHCLNFKWITMLKELLLNIGKENLKWWMHHYTVIVSCSCTTEIAKNNWKWRVWLHYLGFLYYVVFMVARKRSKTGGLKFFKLKNVLLKRHCHFFFKKVMTLTNDES